MNLASIRARCAAAWPSIRHRVGQWALCLAIGYFAHLTMESFNAPALFWFFAALMALCVMWLESRAEANGYCRGHTDAMDFAISELDRVEATRRRINDFMDRRRVKFETTPGRIDRRPYDFVWPDPQADVAPAREEGGANG